MKSAYYSIFFGVKRVLERGRWVTEQKVARMVSSRSGRAVGYALFALHIPLVGNWFSGSSEKPVRYNIQHLSDSAHSSVDAVEKDRRFLTGGNFKMNGTKKEMETIAQNLKAAKLDPDVDVFVSPPSVYIQHMKSLLPANVELAAQNCYMKDKGPFTGELSPNMILDVGAKWVIIGHSERRLIFNENDSLCGEKVCRALHDGLKVVICVGETLEERDAGQGESVIMEQLEKIKSMGCGKWENVVIAYEPVWTVGTGKKITPEEAQDMHNMIRCWIKDNVSECASDVVRIIYSGCITKNNCMELARQPDIDGFLVGGASLKPEFIDIVNVIQHINALAKEAREAQEKEKEKDGCPVKKAASK